jgi:histidinol-phosphate aminotransferase
MSLIENIIRPEIQALAGYQVPDASGFIKLDAMENPYLLPQALRAELGQRLSEVALNRYPVPSYALLKQKITEKLGIPAGFDLILGNGSDELISLISIACAKPGAKVLAPTPGFVMYSMSAKLCSMQFIGVPLRPDLALDKEAMLAAVAEHRPAITYLAYPNNPTGNLYDADEMVEIIRAVGDAGIVVVDEAYQPFAQASFMSRLAEFPNMVVMRTVSKLGLAGIRLGYMSASDALLAEFEKVRPPYNVNVLTQAAAEFMLDRVHVLDEQAAQLRAQRELLRAELESLTGVKVFPSAANFLLVRVDAPNPDADAINTALLERRVLVKNVGKMHPLLRNCLRVTVSTPEENRIFLDAFKASLALPTK